jgi:ankyrin repeat protein
MKRLLLLCMLCIVILAPAGVYAMGQDEMRDELAAKGYGTAHEDFMRAAIAGDSEAVSLFILLGADVNREGQGTLPLIAAACGDNTSVLALIAAGADVNGSRADGWTALHEAVDGDYVDSARALINAGADVNPRETEEGYTPLAWAAHKGALGAVTLLLEAGADHAASTLKGQTALYEAVAASHMDVARALIKAGADLNARDKDGFTPLMIAGQQGDLDMVELLLGAGADRTVKDNRGRTAFEITDEACHHGVAALLR